MKIAVCDDERAIREGIKRLIENRVPDCSIGLFSSGEELLNSQERFDITFLDIQMDGMDGIRAARELRNRGEDTILIFVTALKEYVFEAFDLSTFHYLLKPVSREKFQEVFGRAMAAAEQNQRKKGDVLLVKSKNRNVRVEKRRILYVESQEEKQILHLSRENLTVKTRMSELEKQLGESFYRCHRGYLVNMSYIAEYDSDSVTLDNGEQVYMSRRKYAAFVEAYLKFLRKGGELYGIFH